jgi:menaquinone-dependent protoporphyrinogen oxidase
MLGIDQRDELEDLMQLSAGAEVIVAYASEHGSTMGIAERIAARLRQAGLRVELHSAAAVDALASCDAIVFGSAVYDQRWLPEGEAFVRDNRGALAERPTWLFSVGTFGDRKRFIGRFMRREPRDIAELRDIVRPRDYRVFAGVVDKQRWPLASRILYHLFGGRLGDNRDWDDIDAWAQSIATALGVERPHERGHVGSSPS